ncbi:MAG: hypothetical protein ACRDMH_13085 [Solirubrobacterales bacterium]
MKMSQWADSGPAGTTEGWARHKAAETLPELISLNEDPVAIGSGLVPTGTDGRHTVTLWAATSVGFATVTITVDPNPMKDSDPQLRIVIEPWARVTALRFESEGDPTEGPLPVTLTVGGARIDTLGRDRVQGIALFRACLQLTGSAPAAMASRD